MGPHLWLIALAALGPAQVGDAPGFSWERYVAKKGGFSVKLPGQPQEQDKRVETSRGPVDIHVMSYADEGITFLAYVQGAPGVTQPLREPYLDNRRDEIIRGKRARLVDQTRMTKDGRYPGREMIVRFTPVPNAPDVAEKIRMFLVGERLYEVFAQTEWAKRNDPRVDAFLDSLKFEDGSPTAEAERPAWKVISPAGAGFSVALPGAPDRKQEAVASIAGEVPAVRYEAGAGPALYAVGYIEYPAAATRDPKRLLDATRDAIVAQSKGDLLSQRRVTLGRYPGRDFEAAIPLPRPAVAGDAKSEEPKKDQPGTGRLRCRIYLVGRRVYQLTAAGPRGAEDEEQIEEFFKSFKLRAGR